MKKKKQTTAKITKEKKRKQHKPRALMGEWNVQYKQHGCYLLMKVFAGTRFWLSYHFGDCKLFLSSFFFFCFMCTFWRTIIEVHCIDTVSPFDSHTNYRYDSSRSGKKFIIVILFRFSIFVSFSQYRREL